MITNYQALSLETNKQKKQTNKQTNKQTLIGQKWFFILQGMVLTSPKTQGWILCT
jgi:hypothetical protein